MTASARDIFDQGLALEGQGDLDKAAAYYIRSSDMLPHDLDIAFKAASAQLRLGKLDDALSRLRRIVFADPSHISARSSLANCQLLLDELDLAESNFREVLYLDNAHKNALYGLTSLLLKRNRAAAAQPYIDQLIKVMPSSIAAQTLLAETQEKLGQETQAVASFRKILKDAPDHPPALLGLARTLLKVRRYDEVIDLTVRAAIQAPESADAYELLCQALEAHGDLEDAIEAGMEALRLKPGNAALLIRLSVLNRKLAAYPAAIRCALDAHDLEPAEQAPLNALGSVLAAMKYPKEARALLTGANGTALDPDIRALAEKFTVVSSPVSDTENGEGIKTPITVYDAPELVSSNSIESAEQGASDRPVSPNVDETQGSEAEQKPVLGSGNDDPLPNVLGLTRRDLS